MQGAHTQSSEYRIIKAMNSEERVQMSFSVRKVNIHPEAKILYR